MACKLLELPPDVLREIWTSYLSIEDVVSFGMTAKNMLDLTWSNSQIVQMERDAPIKNVIWLLSKDLSHLRRLDVYYILENELSEEKDGPSEEEIALVPVLFSKLSVLAANKILTNLQTLVIEFKLPTNTYGDMNIIIDLIRNLTHLQSLTWFSAKLEEDFNIGKFFNNYSRLTELTLESADNLLGFNLLTNLKSLNLSFYERLHEGSFDELIRLTQLKYLDIALHNTISDESFMKISNLTNLEELELKDNVGAGPDNLRALLTLPKLNSLKFDCFFAKSTQGAATTLSVIGQLTKLTKLNFMNYYATNINFSAIQGLTNLLELTVYIPVDEVDFGSLSNLTKLDWQYGGFKKSTNLPPKLASLIIASIDMDENFIQDMCSLTHLKDLTMRQSKYNPSVMAQFITQLTTLTEIVITPTAPKELMAAFVHLPNLVNLTVAEIPAGITDELAKLTQLMKVTYWKDKNKDLPAKVPFRVNFLN